MGLCFGGSAQQSLHAAMPDLEFSAERVGYSDVLVEDVVFQLRSGQYINVSMASISPGGSGPVFGPVSVSCPGETAEIISGACAGGRIQVNPGMGLPVINGELDGGSFESDVRELGGRVRIADTDFRLAFNSVGDVHEGRVELPMQSMGGFKALLENLEPDVSQSNSRTEKTEQIRSALSWLRQGQIQGALVVRMEKNSRPEWQFNFDISDLSFDSPDGQYASEALMVRVTGRTESGDGFSLTLDAVIEKGELLLGDFYRNFADASLRIRMNPHWQDSKMKVDAIDISDGGALALRGSIESFAVTGTFAPIVSIDRLSLIFPEAYDRYLESILAVWTLDGLELEGELGWKGKLDAGGFSTMVQTGELALTDLYIDDIRRNRFAVHGLNATIDSSYLDSNHRFELSGHQESGAHAVRCDG
jgi:hypothetical protein